MILEVFELVASEAPILGRLTCSRRDVLYFLELAHGGIHTGKIMKGDYIDPKVFEVLMALICGDRATVEPVRAKIAEKGNTLMDVAETGSLERLLPLGSEKREGALANTYRLSTVLTALRQSGDKNEFFEMVRQLGKYCIWSLSAAGYEPATVSIMSHAYLLHSRWNTLTRNLAYNKERVTLQRIAAKGEYYPAMVLEGKIRQRMGDQEGALKWLKAALPLACEDNSRDRPRSRLHEDVEKLSGGETRYLESPWLELFYLHADRAQRGFPEIEEANEAVIIGCKQDDPDMWYQYAASFKAKWTSGWLYGMTKAASTGNVKAMVELATWYVESEWPYIGNEPPAYVKPTIFDSFPAEENSGGAMNSVSSFFRRTSPSSEGDSDGGDFDLSRQTSEVFKVFDIPNTAEHRVALGYQWAMVASKHLFAPAYLLLAKACLAESVSSRLDTPKEALKKSKDRYTYSSKADYDNAVEAGEIAQESNASTLAIRQSLADSPSDTSQTEENLRPNPLLDVNMAYEYITQVFYAYEAIEIYKGIKFSFGDRFANRFLTIQEVEQLDDNIRLGSKDIPSEWLIWLSNQTQRETFEDEIAQVAEEAMEIVCKQKWDILDSFGDIMASSTGYRRVLPDGNGGVFKRPDMRITESDQLVQLLERHCYRPGRIARNTGGKSY
ncbi:hypothetical protein K431DRAFT_280726 [Polychaeton citri CBS 116435]|uniref:Uncharacterized protein n=1 Tax=Polychaeton citri CBS 116435 TaxID=1314669 RepID=A0A9P4QEW5_9PEZI|nr:hypothetical protein K431DRAFT_280726 [Polychaeton citri CBS 116435]